MKRSGAGEFPRTGKRNVRAEPAGDLNALIECRTWPTCNCERPIRSMNPGLIDGPLRPTAEKQRTSEGAAKNERGRAHAHAGRRWAINAGRTSSGEIVKRSSRHRRVNLGATAAFVVLTIAAPRGCKTDYGRSPIALAPRLRRPRCPGPRPSTAAAGSTRPRGAPDQLSVSRGSQVYFSAISARTSVSSWRRSGERSGRASSSAISSSSFVSCEDNTEGTRSTTEVMAVQTYER